MFTQFRYFKVFFLSTPLDFKICTNFSCSTQSQASRLTTKLAYMSEFMYLSQEIEREKSLTCVNPVLESKLDFIYLVFAFSIDSYLDDPQGCLQSMTLQIKLSGIISVTYILSNNHVGRSRPSSVITFRCSTQMSSATITFSYFCSSSFFLFQLVSKICCYMLPKKCIQFLVSLCLCQHSNIQDFY